MPKIKNHLRRSSVVERTDRRPNEIENLRKENERLKWVIATAKEELEAGCNGSAYKVLCDG